VFEVESDEAKTKEEHHELGDSKLGHHPQLDLPSEPGTPLKQANNQPSGQLSPQISAPSPSKGEMSEGSQTDAATAHQPMETTQSTASSATDTNQPAAEKSDQPKEANQEKNGNSVPIMAQSQTTSSVAIDNKIEQAMDLVKSHLMFAVREEVDVLKEKIVELLDRIQVLEHENSMLRNYVPADILSTLSLSQQSHQQQVQQAQHVANAATAAALAAAQNAAMALTASATHSTNSQSTNTPNLTTASVETSTGPNIQQAAIEILSATVANQNATLPAEP
jgi:hypothetical protein